MALLIAFIFSVFLLCSCFFISYFGKNWNLKPLVSISSGALLSICFLDFLPHSFEDFNEQSHGHGSLWILFGILIQALADIYLTPKLSFLDQILKTDSKKNIHNHSHALNLGSVCSLTGCLSICSFFDGMRFFSSMAITESVAFVTALGLFFHLLSEGVLVTGLALSSNLNKKALVILISCLCGSFFFGALIAKIFLISLSSKILIAFSSGILIYICFIHLLPVSLQKKNLVWFSTGLILFSAFHFVV